MPSRKGKAKRRQHTYRRPRADGGTALRAYSRCPQCSKWCFETRADAEAAVRVIHPGVTMRFYRCAGSWHYTSMTAEQVGGIRARESQPYVPPAPVTFYQYPEETAC